MKNLIKGTILFLSIHFSQSFTQLSFLKTKSSPIVRLHTSASEPETTALDNAIITKFSKYLECKKTDLLTFTLQEFKPLGCTAEESLNVELDGSKFVFISKVVKGGNAKKVGVQVGDVIVGVSGTFNDVVEVVGSSLEKVKSLIAGRNEGDDLVLKVIRGSEVMSRHETALVDLCVLPEKDTDVENCIEALYKADYDIKVDSNDGDGIVDCDDGDTDCMLDAMFDVWSDEVGLKREEEKEVEAKVEKKKPAPWSSRSSPSGTYVRDPKTGKMVNIDE